VILNPEILHTVVNLKKLFKKNWDPKNDSDSDLHHVLFL